jgi:hypothetical protein
MFLMSIQGYNLMSNYTYEECISLVNTGSKNLHHKELFAQVDQD